MLNSALASRSKHSFSYYHSLHAGALTRSFHSSTCFCTPASCRFTSSLRLNYHRRLHFWYASYADSDCAKAEIVLISATWLEGLIIATDRDCAIYPSHTPDVLTVVMSL